MLTNVACQVATHVINLAVLIWLHHYLLARLAPAQYALYPLVMAPMAMVPLLARILSGGLVRYLVEALARNDPARVTQIVSTMAPLHAAAALGLLVVGGCLAWNIDGLLSIEPSMVDDARLMFALLIVGATLGVAVAPFSMGLTVRQNFLALNAIRLATQLVRIVLLIVLLVGVGPRVLWVVVATVSGDVLQHLLNVGASMWLIPQLRFRRGAMRRDIAGELTQFGGWTFLQRTARSIRKFADPMILNRLATDIDVSCFFLGSLVTLQFERLTVVATMPLLAPLVAMHATGDRGGLRSVYLRGGRLGLWVIMIVAVPFFLYRRELVLLYAGAQYMTAATVMGLLLWTLPVLAANVTFRMLAPATGHVRESSLYAVANQTLNILLTLYLVGIRDMGAVGSALATLLVTTAMHGIFMWRLGRKIVGVTFREWSARTLYPGLLPAVVGGAAWALLRWFVSPERWLELGACGLAGAAVYLAVLFFWCARPEDLRDLRFAWLAAKRLWERRPLARGGGRAERP